MSYIRKQIEAARASEERDTYTIFYVEEYELDWDKVEKQTRLYSKWFDTWYCTDTWVGGAIVFFDDAPFALTYQGGRKCEKKVMIFDKEVAAKVKEFMRSMVLEEDEEYDFFDLDTERKDLVDFFYAYERF